MPQSKNKNNISDDLNSNFIKSSSSWFVCECGSRRFTKLKIDVEKKKKDKNFWEGNNKNKFVGIVNLLNLIIGWFNCNPL
jgi:hypothetical protein